MAKKTKSKPVTSGSNSKAKRAGQDSDSAFAVQLRSAVATVDVADALTGPLKRSIDNLLRLAAAGVG